MRPFCSLVNRLRTPIGGYTMIVGWPHACRCQRFRCSRPDCLRGVSATTAIQTPFVFSRTSRNRRLLGIRGTGCGRMATGHTPANDGRFMTLAVELVQVLMECMERGAERSVQSRFIDTWQELTRRFSALIGRSQAAGLLGRAIHQTRTEFAWLPLVSPACTGSALVVALGEAMSEQGDSEVIQATRTLLGNYINLIIALIGPTLGSQVIYRIASKRYA